MIRQSIILNFFQFWNSYTRRQDAFQILIYT